MFKVEAIVREEALEDVKQALFDIEVRGITVSQHGLRKIGRAHV